MQTVTIRRPWLRTNHGSRPTQAPSKNQVPISRKSARFLLAPLTQLAWNAKGASAPSSFDFDVGVSASTNTRHGQLFDHLVGALPGRRYLKLIKSVRLSVEALGFKGSFVAFALF